MIISADMRTLLRNFHQAYKKKSNCMISATLCAQTNLLKRLKTDNLCGIKTKSGADKNIRKILLKYKNSVVLTNNFCHYLFLVEI